MTMRAMHDEAENLFVAELLRSEAPRIGMAAAKRLLGEHPEIAKRWGPVGGRALHAWSDALSSRVNDLAAAVGAGRPELFALQLAWAKVAFHTRGLPIDDLVRSLDAVAASCLDVVPPEDAARLREYTRAARKSLESASSEVPTELSIDTPHGTLAAEYLHAILEGEKRRACEHVLSAARGMPVTEIYERVLTPAMRELGRMWHLGEVNVAEEHFATATTLTAMSQLASLAPVAPRNGRSVLAASVAGNNHEIGIRMVADYFEFAGFRVIYLGPNTPLDDLAVAAVDFKADVVCLAATLPTHLMTVRDTIAQIRGACPRRLFVLAGGGAFAGCDGLATEHGADSCASSPREAVQAACSFLGLPAPAL
jgi:methanogenic corrinoid protein MtbC1